MAVTITITDERAEYDATRRRLRAFDGRAAEAGLLDAEQATKGWRHELGKGVPERPWLAPSADQATRKMFRTAKREIGKVADGDARAIEALKTMGEVLEIAARDYIERGRVRGDDLSDAAKRKDRRKLIHDGAMVGALKTKVGRDRGDS